MLSSYVLAIDVGTSRTAAALARRSTTGVPSANSFGLGRHTDSAPSAIFVSDGELLFGEAAERRGIAQPERLIREFKRRVGDDVPVTVAGQHFAAEDLFAAMAAWVVAGVAEREGAAPEAIIATVPVTWGDYRASLVARALARTVSAPVELVAEPVAAARHYETTTPLSSDGILAVYDLGGGTFDAVLVGRTAAGDVTLIGEPTGIGDFGGADFDDLVLRRVIESAGLSAAALSADASSRVALASLKRECRDAKEALSFDSDAAVPVLVGTSTSTVRLTRGEFEELIEPGIVRTIDVLEDSLDSNGIAPSRLDAVLLTGGSSRIPRVAQLLSERIDRPIAVDADPKAIVALGAATLLVERLDAGLTPSAAVPGAVLAAAADADAAVASALAAEDPAAAGLAPAAGPERTRSWYRRIPAGAAMAGSSLVLATGIVLVSATGLGSSPALSSDAQLASFTDQLRLAIGDTPAAAAATEESAQASAPEPPLAAPPTTQEGSTPTAPTSPTRPRSDAGVARSAPPSSSAAQSASSSTQPSSPSSASSTPPFGQGDGGPDAAPPTGPTTPDPTTPAPEPTDPGATPDPDPTTPPDPDPTTPPDPDPGPSTPPAEPEPEPEPTTPPADPEPTTPPAEPEPTTPPAEPEPTTPPAEPGPSEAPVEPSPAP